MALFPQHIRRSLDFSVLLNNCVTHRQQEAWLEPPTPVGIGCEHYRQNYFSVREIIYDTKYKFIYVPGLFLLKHLTYCERVLKNNNNNIMTKTIVTSVFKKNPILLFCTVFVLSVTGLR